MTYDLKDAASCQEQFAVKNHEAADRLVAGGLDDIAESYYEAARQHRKQAEELRARLERTGTP